MAEKDQQSTTKPWQWIMCPPTRASTTSYDIACEFVVSRTCIDEISIYPSLDSQQALDSFGRLSRVYLLRRWNLNDTSYFSETVALCLGLQSFDLVRQIERSSSPGSGISGIGKTPDRELDPKS